MNNVEPLVKATNVKKYFSYRKSLLEGLISGQKSAMIKAVDDVSLKIYPGETVGLVGESGCGKTTFGRCLAGLNIPDSGSIEIEGRQICFDTLKNRKALYTRVQMIFQNPYASLNPRKTIREILNTPLKNLTNLTPSEREEKIRDLIVRMGLTEKHLDSYPHQFSGGQRQRIAIARALAVNPRFIVADEPVSALDVSIRAQIINLLEELREEFGLTYLFIAHDLSVIYYISQRTVVMYLGKIVEIADTEEIFNHPAHPYTQSLLSAIPTLARKTRKRILLKGSVPSPINPPPGCSFNTRCFRKVGKICETTVPELKEIAPGHFVACHLYC